MVASTQCKMADARAIDGCIDSRRGSTRAIVLLSMGLVANLAALMTFAATLSEIAADWSLDASQSGWIGGIYFAGYAVAVPFLASASDRMDARRLYVASGLLGAAASFAFALFAHGFLLAMILRLLGGIGLLTLAVWVSSPSFGIFLAGDLVAGAGDGLMFKGAIETVTQISLPAVLR